MFHVIANHGRPTLRYYVTTSTLAAQLTREPEPRQVAVELFVSYYNHYVPERETTVSTWPKKVSVNADIDVLLDTRANPAFVDRRDVVVVASVSSTDWAAQGIRTRAWSVKCLAVVVSAVRVMYRDDNLVSWNDFLTRWGVCYTENYNDDEFERGHFNGADTADDGKGKTVTVWPPHEKFPMVIDLQQEQEQQQSSGNNGDDNNVVDTNDVDASHGHSRRKSAGQCSFFIHASFPAKHHAWHRGTTGGSLWLRLKMRCEIASRNCC
jgi:excinuclease UvrABC helicase subunit UvrB